MIGNAAPLIRAAARDGDEDLVAYLTALQHDPCAYCGETGGAIDHVDSRARGGADDHPNLTGSCRRCNSAKATASLIGFLGWRGDPDRAPALAALSRVARWRGVGA